MTYRVRNIGIAVALAAVAALLTSFYVTSYKRHVQRNEDHVTVLVAKKDIKEGTSGSDASKLLDSVEVPRRSVVPGAVTNPDQLTGLVATQRTLQGEQVTTRRFGTESQLGVRAQLTGTMRAVAVWGDQTQLLAGTLKSGDHVDLVANIKLNDSGANFDRVVLRDLQVLQAPDAPSKAQSRLEGSSQKFPVMLAVSDTQVQKLWYTVNNASGSADGWSLVLRPAVNESDSPEVLEWSKTVLLDGLNRYQLRRALNGGIR
jgi:Flp pilus assembly protein CpaB